MADALAAAAAATAAAAAADKPRVAAAAAATAAIAAAVEAYQETIQPLGTVVVPGPDVRKLRLQPSSGYRK
jgi:hypothetical protein